VPETEVEKYEKYSRVFRVGYASKRAKTQGEINNPTKGLAK